MEAQVQGAAAVRVAIVHLGDNHSPWRESGVAPGGASEVVMADEKISPPADDERQAAERHLAAVQRFNDGLERVAMAMVGLVDGLKMQVEELRKLRGGK